ncbi:MAG: hypothetical protein EXQ58_13645 [Acidobacteria bacterium]|nr:hypothetical protein [Acidobacteriota bacterium]
MGGWQSWWISLAKGGEQPGAGCRDDERAGRDTPPSPGLVGVPQYLLFLLPNLGQPSPNNFPAAPTKTETTIMLKLNRPADLVNPIGMPNLHAAAFRDVAMLEKCVIIVRATGPTCPGLLEEGYDTKGYRIHGKSCDWGPMAGIVLRDPRLNKAGLGK